MKRSKTGRGVGKRKKIILEAIYFRILLELCLHFRMKSVCSKKYPLSIEYGVFFPQLSVGFPIFFRYTYYPLRSRYFRFMFLVLLFYFIFSSGPCFHFKITSLTSLLFNFNFLFLSIRYYTYLFQHFLLTLLFLF